MKVEVTNISKHGFWILAKDKEYFLSKKDFPWFVDKTIREISDVKALSDTHLYWEDLDIDLSLDMIENPQRYPLQDKINQVETI